MSTFVDVPEIKLIRTDTTLDLSQKAEKVCLMWAAFGFLQPPLTRIRLWDCGVGCGSMSDKTKKIKKAGPYDTQDSRMVPHCSTNWAQQCLTSQFGRDAVLSLRCDRKTYHVRAVCLFVCITRNWPKQNCTSATYAKQPDLKKP